MKRMVALLLIVALLAAACLPWLRTTPPSRLISRHGLTRPDGAYLEDMVNTFNETNEDGIFVQLNVYHWDVFFDCWVASVAAG